MTLRCETGDSHIAGKVFARYAHFVTASTTQEPCCLQALVAEALLPDTAVKRGVHHSAGKD